MLLRLIYLLIAFFELPSLQLIVYVYTHILLQVSRYC
jgi:hypothetical protein